MKESDINVLDLETGEVKEFEKTPVVSFGYDPVKDIAPVDPYGYINLAEAYENRSVPTVVADEIANYNGIDDPESIIGTPRDIFEAYRMNDRIQNIDRQVSSDKDKTS